MGDRDEAGLNGRRVDVLVGDVGVADLRAGQADGGDAVLVRGRLQTNAPLNQEQSNPSCRA